MTPEQQAVLEPIAIVLSGIQADLDNKTTDELLFMLKACKAVTRTNCWVWTYQAAKYLEDELDARTATG